MNHAEITMSGGRMCPVFLYVYVPVFTTSFILLNQYVFTSSFKYLDRITVVVILS